jgi:hypothetical protein
LFGDAFDRFTCWLIVLSAVVSAIPIGTVIARSLQAALLLREQTSIRVSRLISEAVEAQLDDVLPGSVINVSLRLVQAAERAIFSRFGVSRIDSPQSAGRRPVLQFGAVSTVELLAGSIARLGSLKSPMLTGATWVCDT